MQTVYLVDGSGYIFRAFYAIGPLTTRSGFPTNALFGFTKMLRKFLNEKVPEHVAVAFDVGRETFRLKLYPQYKANRVSPPKELVEQLPHFRTIVSALGMPVIELPGYEADDVIGTMAKLLTERGHQVVIITGDKDLLQLVGERVRVYDPMHDKHYSPPEVVAKLGVEPHRVVDFLALVGDSSDNVPGVDGVGPKTAVQLIQKYETVDKIIDSLPAIREDSSLRGRAKVAQAIEGCLGNLRLSRRLVEINCRVPIAFEGKPLEALKDEEVLAHLRRTAPRSPLLRSLIERFEFSSLLSDMQGPAEIRRTGPQEKERYTTIYADDFPAFVEQIARVPRFAFDTETTSLNVFEAAIVGASFCWGDTEAFYVPLGHKQSDRQQVAIEDFKSGLGKLFASQNIKKSGQNLKYDIQILARLGMEVDGIEFDSMVGAYLLNPDRGAYDLAVLAREYLDRDVIEFDEVLGEGRDFSDIAIEPATRYACQDAHFVWLLRQKLLPMLKEQELEVVSETIDTPLVPVLARMELAGVGLDQGLLSSMSQEFSSLIDQARDDIFATAGGEFNINSPKQLAEILFDRLGISTKGVKRTKTGISTDSSVLERLSEVHPLPGKILAYRSLHKLKSTYVDALPAQITPCTRRLHTKLNQTVTATGRLSSSDPNLQNIPISTAEGRRIREAFIACPGNLLISADYSQIELRILAHMSGDKNMILAFQNDIDVHAQTARQLFDIAPLERVGSEQRRLGKTINFGIIYGMSGFRLSRELSIPLPRANAYIEEYFKFYSGVRAFFERLEKEALSKSYVSTIFGRKRMLSGIDSSGRDQGFLLRAALNAPIQGSAADIIKKAMIAIDSRIRREHLPLSMVLQIHDELLFECPEDWVETAREIVCREMEGVVELSVPLKVEVGAGRNWQAAH